MKSALPRGCGVHRERFLSPMCTDDPGKAATAGPFFWHSLQKVFLQLRPPASARLVLASLPPRGGIQAEGLSSWIPILKSVMGILWGNVPQAFSALPHFFPATQLVRTPNRLVSTGAKLRAQPSCPAQQVRRAHSTQEALSQVHRGHHKVPNLLPTDS
jgi:hypothetical protein